MAETTKTQRMLDAFKRAQADVASLTDWLECELEKFDQHEQVTWATAGTLGHVREKLIETLAFFSGVEQDEIQRCLDELHM